MDGSQFSFSVDCEGEISCRSKGQDLVVEAPEKMFSAAVESVKAAQGSLVPGWVYRGEYLSKPKHNSLAYSRIPANHIVIFDVQTNVETYLSHELKKAECERIGFECVPLVYEGLVTSLEMFNGFLQRDSFLGGCKVEGVVAKNYALFTADKKIAIGKYVSEEFKEIHRKEWKKGNPTPTDIVQKLIGEYKTPPRWRKAVQHLREAGQLTQSPKDIGPLMIETVKDVEKECADEIKAALYEHFWPQIRRGITNGLPEFYKQELASNAFKS